MKTFDELWKDIEERSQRWAIPIVQDYKELEYIFNLMKGCESYLEIGTAEGNGLYVLAQAIKTSDRLFVKEDDEISSRHGVEVCEIIDFGELHTKAARDEVIAKLQEMDISINENYGNSHNTKICPSYDEYDAVFIDAGHTYEDVIADAIAYGHLATKYIFFHDIQLPEVRKAFDWYCAQNPQFKRSEFINSTTYGYGILEV